MNRFISHVAVSLLALSMTAAARSATTADIVFVVDESGSMSGEHAWIGSMVAGLDTALTTAGVSGNRYGLVGFGASGGGGHAVAGHQHQVGGAQFGTAADLTLAVSSLVLSGGTEDGYSGLNTALGYTFRPGAAINMILITDEDRDNFDATLNFANILAGLDAKGALLNAVINATLPDDSGLPGGALGHDWDGDSYRANGAGGFTTHNALAPAANSTINAYYNLALATGDGVNLGGAAWDLNQLRAGGLTATSFTNAFVEVKVQEIIRQPVPETGTTALLLAIALGALVALRTRFSARAA